MTDPSARSAPADRQATAPAAVTAGLGRLVTAGDRSDLDPAERVSGGVQWACAALASGVSPAQLCDAVVRLGPTNWNAVALAAGPCSTLAARDGTGHGSGGHGSEDRMTARLAAVQLVACAVAASTDQPKDPERVAAASTIGQVGDPFHRLLDAALTGDPAATEDAWVAAAQADDVLAAQALVSAGAAGYHLDETRLVLAAQLTRWCGDDRTDGALARLVARRVGGTPQDAEHASMRRADASVLAADAMERSPETFGRLPRTSHDRVSVLATGIALTAPDALPNLLLASLEDGLSPEDLVDAIALLRAAGCAITSLTEDDERTRAAMLACAGADALHRSLVSALSADLRYELALCAPEGPSASALEPVAELWVPPYDDGALEDLLVALEEGDPDAAAEAATAVPPDDPDATDAAWRAVVSTAVTDPSPELAAIGHVVAMERGFRTSSHPARIWFLSSAARLAAAVATQDRPVADMSVRHLAELD